MITLIENHLKELQDLCRTFRVRRLEIFGSSVDKNKFDPNTSDLDLLVEFQPLKEGQYADTYFGLLEALETLFQRHVDLVMPSAIKNPFFLESINQCREIIYAA